MNNLSDTVRMAKRADALDLNFNAYGHTPRSPVPEIKKERYGFVYYFTVDRVEKLKLSNCRTTGEFIIRDVDDVAAAWEQLEYMQWAEGLENVTHEVTKIDIRTWGLA